MPATTTTTTSARFMLLTAASALRATAGARRRRAHAAARVQHSDVQVLQRRLLQAFELDERFAIVQNLPQLRVARVGQIALRLHDEVVRRHADFELALLGFEFLLGKLARGL